jgi:hypothetical protein
MVLFIKFFKIKLRLARNIFRDTRDLGKAGRVVKRIELCDWETWRDRLGFLIA